MDIISTFLKKNVQEIASLTSLTRQKIFEHITFIMREAIDKGRPFAVFEEETENGDVNGIDFRCSEKDGSFVPNGDERNDTIVGVEWNEEAGIPMVATLRDEEELDTSTHLLDEDLSLEDMMTILELVEQWRNA